ncbi:unnamed protein product [Pelagomonas calceolata]|uniref:GRF-like zinc ribbon domain-containing protein n=1 Tax=Pelagomonas calceolata TaxID=35677 RepID=A0A8J2WT89_9STRA|nr:unnamed protein product [Pelagomonas calceolata]
MADCIDLTVDSDDEARRKRVAPAPAPAPRAPAPAPKRRKKDILDTSSDEEEEEAAAPVAAPAPAAPAPAPAPAAAPEADPTPPKCKTCGAPCELRTARSAKNDGRRYWKCPQHEDAWVGWADAKGVKGGGKISKGGQSFADIRKQEKREAAGTETRAKQRNETGGRGNVFGFDNRRGIKGVVSKETERKDPNAFKGVDASAVRRAAQGPAGPVRGSQRGDADELRRKRMARFGGGAATATRP